MRQVLSFLEDHPEIAHVETLEDHGARAALARLAEEKVELLVINGGDGTVQRTLSLLLGGNSPFDRVPLLAPVRSGRTCMSALDLGSPKDPVAAVAQLLETLRRGEVERSIVERPVLRVALEPDGASVHGMFLGVGMIYRAIKLTHRIFPNGRGQGVLGSGIVTGLLIGRAVIGATGNILAADDVELRLDGKLLAQRRFQLLIVTTLERLFLKIQPFWSQTAGPVRLTALTPGCARNPAAILRILRGRRPVDDETDARYTSANVELAELRLDCGLTVDGELFEPLAGRTVQIDGQDRVRFVRVR